MIECVQIRQTCGQGRQMAIKIGDTVQLKSGGPVMTVQSEESNETRQMYVVRRERNYPVRVEAGNF